MKKKILPFLLILLISISGTFFLAPLTVPAAVAAADTANGLYKEEGDWKYYENGRFVEKSGLAKRSADGKWCYVKDGLYDKTTTCLAKKLGSNDSHWYYVKKGSICRLSKAKWIRPAKGTYDFYINKKGRVSDVCPKPDKITWIGDCLTVGMRQTPAIKDKYHFTFSNANTFASVSKSWTSAGVSGKNGKDTLDALAKKKKIKPFLVMALGTNQAGFPDKKAMRAQIDYVMKKAGKKTRVIFMTSVLSWGNSWERTTYNKVVRQKAGEYPDLYLADWEATVKKKWFSDRAHYTLEGNAQLFRCIYAQVKKAAKEKFAEDTKTKTSVEIK